tara:strand:- start:103 stop:462 length:360 start_codon:yes stop_codon:yes gene_type:complete
MLKINQSLVRKFHKPGNLEKMDRADCQSPRAKHDNSRTPSIRESIEEIQPLVQLGNLKLKSSSRAKDASDASDASDDSKSDGKRNSIHCFSVLGGKLFSCFRWEEEAVEEEHPKLTGSV